jgi:hypothetical protein
MLKTIHRVVITSDLLAGIVEDDAYVFLVSVSRFYNVGELLTPVFYDLAGIGKLDCVAVWQYQPHRYVFGDSHVVVSLQPVNR